MMTDKPGNLLIISAPSGAGKTSLVKALVEKLPYLNVSISHTTREKRPYEKDGIDYHFVDEESFDSLIKEDEFLEYAEVFGYYYGTSRLWVKQQLQAGRDIILEIDWQGARQVKDQIDKAVGIFILPPSYQVLKSRLEGRGDKDEIVLARMQGARNELKHYSEYDFLMINDDFDTALHELQTIIAAMKHGYHQQQDFYDNFVRQILNDAEK
jgi:guanylate kinase